MVSGIVTALLLVLFVAGWIRLWSPKLKPELDAAAYLPLEEDASPRISGETRR
ncbi:cbb3-type cytochrome oxidase subunit 3 [Marilutibacter chinensis]|uniref:Cbb3-type cytochrome c oxidase subunit 3 n=1 Tax=Marilutibacter chinensis TaxID=2912247 RepID=A0ABS9HST9_9GAMM|nr:cbb3-type cytochrome c oxidase subunit 3 [Lysobacter chinensis]MCF7221415.1 cbb3-type cytochrome c oxidase subunit 3 [Lysobacter chinensis]